jgi:hypothetical protein
VVEDLKAEACDNAGIRMGSTAASLFYCNDYLAKQHTDKDVGIGICAQLEKQCADQYGYSFAYPEYGFYIATAQGLQRSINMDTNRWGYLSVILKSRCTSSVMIGFRCSFT